VHALRNISKVKIFFLKSLAYDDTGNGQKKLKGKAGVNI
jgi:hypothetical protein